MRFCFFASFFRQNKGCYSLIPQGLMGVHTGASQNCGSRSFPFLLPKYKVNE